MEGCVTGVVRVAAALWRGFLLLRIRIERLGLLLTLFGFAQSSGLVRTVSIRLGRRRLALACRSLSFRSTKPMRVRYLRGKRWVDV